MYTCVALKADTRLFLCHVEGDRSLAHARQLFQQLEQCRDPESGHPLVASDGWDAFKRALLEIYGHEEPVPGLALPDQLKTHIILPDDLGYVQVRKIRKNQRVVRIERHIVFGAPLDVLVRLQSSGNGNIHTSYIERFNGTIRGCLARLVRRTLNFSKQLVMHTASIDIFQAWYNFVKPHQSLRQLLNQPSQGHRKWQQRTPAMAEGITDHIWTLEELFSFRVPIH